MEERKSLAVTPLSGFDPEIGRWLWALEDVRRTIKVRLQGTSQHLIDIQLEGMQSIGSLLYHIALIEADWFFEEVLVSEWTTDILALFPYENLNDEGDLTNIEGITLEDHFNRLDRVRSTLMTHFKSMDISDWRKPRMLEKYDVTPEWVVYHLIEHESHHRGQIFQMLTKLENTWEITYDKK